MYLKVRTVLSFVWQKAYWCGGQMYLKSDCVWNVMAHAQKPDFVFLRNGRVHLTRQGRQFSRLLAAEVCASAVVILDTPCSEEVWRVLATHSIRRFPLHLPFRASPCAITFQLDSTPNAEFWDKLGRKVTCSGYRYPSLNTTTLDSTHSGEYCATEGLLVEWSLLFELHVNQKSLEPTTC